MKTVQRPDHHTLADALRRRGFEDAIAGCRSGGLLSQDVGSPLGAWSAGVTRDALTDAIAVATLFNIITRYDDALAFAIPTGDEFDRAGSMLLKRRYGPR